MWIHTSVYIHILHNADRSNPLHIFWGVGLKSLGPKDIGRFYSQKSICVCVCMHVLEKMEPPDLCGS